MDMDPAQPDPAPSTDHVDPWLLDAHEQARRLGSDPETGLTSAEAADRLARLGPNRLEAAATVPGVAQGPGAVRGPSDLPAAGGHCRVARRVVARGRERRAVEAIVIAAIVLANGILGYGAGTEPPSERSRPSSGWAAPSAHVVRDSRESTIAADEVVPGDVLVLAEV